MASFQDPSYLKTSLTSFPYSSDLINVCFGKDQKKLLILSAFVKDEFFATASNLPTKYQLGSSINFKNVAGFNHISLNTGLTLIHFLYTNKYQVLGEENTQDSFEVRMAGLFRKHLSNLFAAEMCNLSHLQNIIWTELTNIGSFLNISKLLQIVGYSLNSEIIKQRMNETAKSRNLLIAYLKINLEVAFKEDEKIFVGDNIFRSVHANSFLEEMETKVFQLMFDRIMHTREEFLILKEREKDARRILDESKAEKESKVKKIQLTEMQLMTGNENNTACDVVKEIDGTATEDISSKNNSNQHSEIQMSDYEFEQKSETIYTPQDSDDGH